MDDMKWFQIIVSIIIVIMICALISSLIYSYVIEASMYEVETYSVGCEISQMVYTKPIYKMGVRCDDFSAVLEITEEQFAQYIVGEIVEIEVIIEASSLTDCQRQEYKLLGPVIEN